MIDGLSDIAVTLWHALASLTVAQPQFGTLLAASSNPEVFAGPAISTTLTVMHLIGLALGLGGSAAIDILLMRHLYNRAITTGVSQTCERISKLVKFGCLLLCVSGVGFLVLHAGHAQALLSNPRLAATIAIVALMMLNVALIQRLVLVRVHKSIGRPLVANASLSEAAPVLTVMALSIAGWSAATLLGYGAIAAVGFIASLIWHWLQPARKAPATDAEKIAVDSKAAPLSAGAAEVGTRGSGGIWRVIGRDIGWLLLLSTAINLTMFAAPLHMLLVYDRVLSSGSTETLVVLTVMCIVLLLAMSLLTAARQWLLIGKSEEIDRTLGPALFRRETRDRRDSGTATLADLAATRQLVISPAASALLDLPFAPLFFVGLFAVHSYFGYLALAGLGIIVAVAILGDLFASGGAKRAAHASAMARQLVGGMHGSAASVRAMGLGDRVGMIWGSLNFSANGSQSGVGAHSAIVSQIVKFLRMGLQSLALALGAWLVLHKEASSGAMIASSIIMGRALAPLEVLIGSWKSLLPSFAALRRVSRTSSRILDHDDDDASRTRLPIPSGELRARVDVHRHCEDGPPVLSDISLNVAPGEVLAILGQGGSGKSTLARLLVGIDRPMQGTVKLDAVELADWPRSHVGPHIGYLGQDSELLDGTVGDNISRFELSLAGDAREQVNRSIIEAAMLCGAHDAISALPKAYDTPIGVGGSPISASQRRHIALARAVYGPVRLVVLDDPTSGLDAAGERAVMTMLLRLKERRAAVVIITHHAGLIQHADKVAVLDNGKVVRQGTPRELLNIHPIQPPSPPVAPNGRAAAGSAMPAHGIASGGMGVVAMNGRPIMAAAQPFNGRGSVAAAAPSAPVVLRQNPPPHVVGGAAVRAVPEVATPGHIQIRKTQLSPVTATERPEATPVGPTPAGAARATCERGTMPEANSHAGAVEGSAASNQLKARLEGLRRKMQTNCGG